MKSELDILPIPLELEQDAALIELRLDGGRLTGQMPEQAPQTITRRINWLFVVTWLLPMFLGSVYFIFIASNQYMSETSFVVRSTTGSNVGNIATLVQNQGLARANDETQDVIAYAQSYDMMKKLIDHDNLLAIYNNDEGDMFNKYPNIFGKNTSEKLYKHYLTWTDISLDDTTGIVTLRTFAFTPQDAQKLTAGMVAQSEVLINRLNDRAQADAIAFSQKLVDQAQKDFINAEDQLTAFRNQNGTADPGHEAVMSFHSTTKLSAELAVMEADLSQKMEMTPRNPAIPALREQIRSYQSVINRQQSHLAGDKTSLSTKLASYEQLSLKKLLAVHALENAVLNLEHAKNEAGQQHFYIQTIVEPSLPDVARYPKVWLDMLLIAFFGACVYGILSSAFAITKEHTS